MIDTYGMDDINTQAIRELTTEVDGVKRRVEKVNTELSSEITSVENELKDLIKIDFGTPTASFTFSAGASHQFSIIPGSIPTGYKISMAIFGGATGDGGYIDTLLAERCNPNSEGNQVTLNLINVGASEVTSSGVRIYYIFTKKPTV